jgi:ABC-2 type transport system ATP-binding protein
LNTTTPDTAMEASGLGRRYRRGWALRECSFTLPAGRVAALVGPNGAGKSTLMALAVGLLRPTEGTIRVLGREPGRWGSAPGPAFLAQGKPLYRRFTVEEMLAAGRHLNPHWDQRYAERLVAQAGVRRDARVGTLSGGERTRVALAVALARRPALLMLDEPLADLDPLAREEVMQAVMAEVAESGMTVLFSSHVLADVEAVCDHLLLLTDGRVRLAGDVQDLVDGHRLMIGPRRPHGHGFAPSEVVEARETGRQQTVLIRAGGWTDTTGWEKHEPTLEELAMAYLRTAAPADAAAERPAVAA